MKKPLLFALCLALLGAAPAWADDNYPGGWLDESGRPPYVYKGERKPLPGPVISVAGAKSLNKSFAPVLLVGKIVEHLEGVKYRFVDGSGEIIVQIRPSRWDGMTVGPNDIVVIDGKLDTLTDPTEVEAVNVATRNHYYATEPPAKGGFMPIGVVSVQEALTLPDTAPLALEGWIDKKLEAGRFLFHDRSGSIVLNTDEANPLVAGPYDPGDLMVVEGRVDQTRTQTEIDVETIVDRSNFAPTVIEKEVVVPGAVVVEETTAVPGQPGTVVDETVVVPTETVIEETVEVPVPIN